MKKLFKGIWADRLEIGDELPIGGSIFRDELTTKLILDINSFNGQLDSYHSPQNISENYVKNREKLIELLSGLNSKVNPYIFYVTHTIQQKVHSLMDIKPDYIPNDLERILKFKNDKAKLTELIGISMCAERAAIGKYLLQNVLEEPYSSTFMAGVETPTPSDDTESHSLEAHSFIIIKDPNLKTYVFDIARPFTGGTIPNIIPFVLETDIPLTYELFDKTKNLLVGATEVLMGQKGYFGVGNSMLMDQELNVYSKD